MDGIINVYKERGWTSFDVVAKLRGIFGQKKIGHTGTLDPEAEGVLVVCLGQATRLVERITGSDKEYLAGIRLGLETDTEDIWGKPLSGPAQSAQAEAQADVQANAQANVRVDTQADAGGPIAYAGVWPTEAEFRAAVAEFEGGYEQCPPMYSAKKIGGKKLYEYARAGKSVERRPVFVQISSISVESVDLPQASFRVRCGKGTYIRTLCADIGRKLGTGAVMSSLLRTRVGAFRVEDSVRLETLQQAKERGELERYVRPAIYLNEPTIVSFGKFDGGHLGHQLIFDRMKALSCETGFKTAVLTFSANPQAVISGEPRARISGAQEHLTRLKNSGMDYVLEFPMTRQTAQMSAEDFLKEILVDGMQMRHLVVGEDCAFGHKKSGNVELLRARERQYGFQTHVLKKVLDQDLSGREISISSSLIREEIAAGEVARAARLLGRYFSISGVVVRGRGLGGRVLGFPTANLIPDREKSLPREGVYASRVLLGQQLYLGMTSVGKNPTVSDDNPLRVETYIVGVGRELYGEKIRVEFVDFMREQVKFDSMEALRCQLEADRDRLMEYRYVLDKAQPL